MTVTSTHAPSEWRYHPRADAGKKGSWSTDVAPYFPFLEFGGSIDMARCPRPAGYVENAAGLDPQVGLGRIIDLHHRLSTSYQIC
jgi:hypothetical protein